VPTPLPTACSTTLCPTVSSAWRKSASYAVRNTSGTAAASVSDIPRGTETSSRSCTTRCVAIPPPETMPITRSPGFADATPSPTAATVPAYSSPGTSLGTPGGAG